MGNMPYDKPCFLGLSHYFFTYKSYPALASIFCPRFYGTVYMLPPLLYTPLSRKPHHTPTAPIALLRMNAAGIITTIYRISEDYK